MPLPLDELLPVLLPLGAARGTGTGGGGGGGGGSLTGTGVGLRVSRGEGGEGDDGGDGDEGEDGEESATPASATAGSGTVIIDAAIPKFATPSQQERRSPLEVGQHSPVSPSSAQVKYSEH